MPRRHFDRCLENPRRQFSAADAAVMVHNNTTAGRSVQCTVDHAAVTQTHPLQCSGRWSVGSPVDTAYQRPYLDARVPLAPYRRLDAPTKPLRRLASFLRQPAQRPTDWLDANARCCIVRADLWARPHQDIRHRIWTSLSSRLSSR